MAASTAGHPNTSRSRLVGVVAQADIAREGKEEQTGALVVEISQPEGRA